MTTTSSRISRRTVLQGLGTAIALPWLEAMAPAARLGAAASSGRAQPSAKRMAFLYVPNGVHMADWTPDAEGHRLRDCPGHPRSRSKPVQGRPARAHRPDPATRPRPNGDGAGDHARALASFLTGAQPRKTDGADIRVGVSVDQVAAQKVGRPTRFPSLELGCEPGATGGQLRLGL